MEVRILRRREVERLTRLSKASIYRKMRTGTFPLPLKLGGVRPDPETSGTCPIHGSRERDIPAESAKRNGRESRAIHCP